jgi:hypothetical protein
MDQLQKCSESGESKGRSPGYLVKTGGAKDPIFVFGNAFPAEISPAFRAKGSRFTKSVVVASLMDEIIHNQVLCERRHDLRIDCFVAIHILSGIFLLKQGLRGRGLMHCTDRRLKAASAKGDPSAT